MIKLIKLIALTCVVTNQSSFAMKTSYLTYHGNDKLDMYCKVFPNLGRTIIAQKLFGKICNDPFDDRFYVGYTQENGTVKWASNGQKLYYELKSDYVQQQLHNSKL